ncbi:MAG: hypothetical protein ACI9N1_002318 [Flavobacteriales bacterium]|jgi:hypothetical protein
MIKLLMILPVLIWVNHNYSQNRENNPDTIYSQNQYVRDFKQLVKSITKSHPEPYMFISKDSLNTLKKSELEKITDTTTITEFLWSCKSIVAAIGCAHLDISYSEDLNEVSPSQLFPLRGHFIEDELYVIDAKNNSENVPIGAKIISINGLNTKIIRNELILHCASDGYNQSQIHHFINLRFVEYCSILLGHPAFYKIEIEHEGEKQIIQLNNQNDNDFENDYQDGVIDQLNFELNPSTNSAIITIESFGFYQEKWPIFKTFIDSCFRQIEESKIPNLTIDLRGNYGGDPYCGAYLLSFLSKEPFTYFYDEGDSYDDLKDSIIPSSIRFKGKLYILINGACSSTTGHFCSLVRSMNLAIFVGTETGSSFSCNDNSSSVILKNTLLDLWLPATTIRTTATNLPLGMGILPDYEIKQSLEDVLKNTDSAMGYVLKEINK